MKVQFLDAATRMAVQPEVEGDHSVVGEAFNQFMAKCAVAYGLNGRFLSVRDCSPERGLIVRTMSDGHEVRLYSDYHISQQKKD